MNRTRYRTSFITTVAALCSLALTVPAQAGPAERPGQETSAVDTSHPGEGAPATAAQDALHDMVGDHPALHGDDIDPTSTRTWGERDELVSAGDSVMGLPLTTGDDTTNDVAYMSASSGHSLTFDLPDDATTHQVGGALVAATDDRPTLVTHLTQDGHGQALGILNGPEDELLFNFDREAGQRWEPTPDGGLSLVDQDGTPVLGMEAPWAIDAQGTRLPTRYVIEGESIRQIVTTDGATFPVVADPSWWWWTKAVGGCAAQVAPVVLSGGAAVAARFPKLASRIKSIARTDSDFAREVRAVGGADNAAKAAFRCALTKLRDAVPSRVRSVLTQPRLTPQERSAGAAVWALGGEVIWDLIGIPSCVDIAREVF